MGARLNRKAATLARQLIREGKFVHDIRDDWSEHAPTTDRQNSFIESQGWDEYARWHLGVDDSLPKDRKGRYSFPFGDFAKVHRCGVISLESRASQYDHNDILDVAQELLRLMDEPPLE